MPDFWLGTFDLERPDAATDSVAAPILATRTRRLAIEVLRYDEEFAILFSSVDDLEQPSRLTCIIGFANAAKACSVWRDRGFPLVDAVVEYDGKTLSVISPYFADASVATFTAMQYERPLITIDGVDFDPSKGSPATLSTDYEQYQESPDGAWPSTRIVRRSVTWTPERTGVSRTPAAGLDLDVAPARCPSLAPFANAEGLQPVATWCGASKLPATGQYPARALTRVARADAFGVPAFRFERVEVLGFRIELADLGRDYQRLLARMIKPLNFHLYDSPGGGGVPDFRYKPATRTLLIELLRYGSMKLQTPSLPLSVDDFQCQHELLVRVLVGRVDDDTTQAHAPAVYVPAIFVDNPWSKVLGRDVQGFDKRMANFCVSRNGAFARLCPDGRLVDSKTRTLGTAPEALANITTVSLVDKAGSPENGSRILEIDCAPDTYADWDAFESVDLDLALGASALSGTRWRQSDFDSPEFRRSFARSAVADSLRGFRSIQVSPVANRPLDRTWISGTFTVQDDIQIARPAGLARLKLYAQKEAPEGWNLLCNILSDGPTASLSFTRGAWYRLKCAMDLHLDSGF